MKYYIISGEASGDLHGSNLIKELKKLDDFSEIRCWGGDLMQEAGGNVIKHFRDLAFMGFMEVLLNIKTIIKNLSFCKKDIMDFNPDVVILIDYPGFNLRIAQWAKKNGLKVIYYISPQVWAWKENRVKVIKKSVDKMMVILPFEKEFYQKWGYHVDYVGHPLIEVIHSFRNVKKNSPLLFDQNKKIIALLPGSRKQEILKKLPIMLHITTAFQDYHFVVAKAPGVDDGFYDKILSSYDNVSAVSGKTYALLSESTAAIVTSGTATLETAIFGVPEIICYKGNNISYQIAKRLIKIKYIGLVNLIMNRSVVKELIQQDLTPVNLTKELKMILDDADYRKKILSDYEELREVLGKGGNASNNAAHIIVDFLKSSTS
jgi:lipid-A-disaccharide synthase